MRNRSGFILVAWITTALLPPSLAWAQVKLPFLGTAGANQCEKWLEERGKKNDSILRFGLEGWVLGFVSGVDSGLISGGSAPADSPSFLTDEPDVLVRIDSYCRARPADIL